MHSSSLSFPAHNTTASLFKLSLKEKYDPENVKEDYLIEDILQRAFVAGILEEQPSKLDIDYLKLSSKWIDIKDEVLKKQ